MYLIHLSLRPPPGRAPLPAGTAEAIAAQAVSEDGLEHVAVHASAWPHPVVGLFLRAAGLAAAEAAAEALWQRARAAHPPLSAWELTCAEVPLLPVWEGRVEA
ncbi:hypothetical protein [Streptomyces sp. ODS05-4]|uniref:hypothetical protein n=1 Tax=Streptomyces sp. ODS05-4 TaxID=2944939 RepID=UPI002108AA05|nr:hypothetical protein [Streptomyces sp. ODS05-4]